MERKKILLVDDDAEYLKLVLSIMEASAIGADTANCAARALELLATESYRLMITDCNMPGMDGYQLAREALKLRPELSIVMMTGDASPQLHRRAQEAGIAEVHLKPCSAREIRAIVGYLHAPEVRDEADLEEYLPDYL